MSILKIVKVWARLLVLALVYTVTFFHSNASASQKTTRADGPPNNISEQVSKCGVQVHDASALLQPGSITIFGELHGTQEAPTLVGNLACRAASSGLPVRVGLEIPSNMQPNLGAFLSSDGNQHDVEQLTQGIFWTYGDGRSSKAMLALIDRVRLLKQAGKNINVFLFDIATMDIASRDKHMAKNILSAIERDPNAVFLILTGNLHARTKPHRWMSWYIVQAHTHLVSLNMANARGSAWTCTRDGCGPMRMGGRDRGQQPFIERFDQPDDNGYNGLFYVGAVTASPPAKPEGDSAKNRQKKVLHPK